MSLLRWLPNSVHGNLFRSQLSLSTAPIGLNSEPRTWDLRILVCSNVAWPVEQLLAQARLKRQTHAFSRLEKP